MNVVIDGVTFVPVQEFISDSTVLSALELRFCSDAGDNLTVRQYLHKLLFKLWKEGEGFSSKRPFGNSGWSYELYEPLIKAGFIKGDYSEDYGIENFDDKEASEYVEKMITAALFGVNV